MITERKVTSGLKRDLIELELGWLVVELLLVLIDLVDTLYDFLRDELVALDVQVIPNDEFPIETGVEDLLQQVLSHVHKLGQQHELVDGLVLLDELHDLHGLIPDGLSHKRPALLVVLLALHCLLHVEGHQLLADSDQLLNVLAQLGGNHDEVVLSHVTISSFVGVAVIYIFQDLYLLLEVSGETVDVLSPALNSVLGFAVFYVQTIYRLANDYSALTLFFAV